MPSASTEEPECTLCSGSWNWKVDRPQGVQRQRFDLPQTNSHRAPRLRNASNTVCSSALQRSAHSLSPLFMRR